MDYGTFMATEGGRKCPLCGRYAKKGTVGNLSFISNSTGGMMHVSMYGHLPGYGCNRDKRKANHEPTKTMTENPSVNQERLVRPGEKLLVEITFPSELEEFEACHPDMVLEDFMASRNDGSWKVEVHSILPARAPLEVGCVVTTNGGQSHTIAEIGFAGSEGVAEDCFYHWNKNYPYEIEHAAMNSDRDTVVSVSWPNH